MFIVVFNIYFHIFKIFFCELLSTSFSFYDMNLALNFYRKQSQLMYMMVVLNTNFYIIFLLISVASFLTFPRASSQIYQSLCFMMFSKPEGVCNNWFGRTMLTNIFRLNIHSSKLNHSSFSNVNLCWVTTWILEPNFWGMNFSSITYQLCDVERIIISCVSVISSAKSGEI